MGSVINGRYLLKQRVGAGAAGEVFLAADGISGHDVAMKFLTYRSTNPFAIEQFKREFSTLTQLRHPHITRVYDFAFDELSESYFFTSEFVQGDDFFTVLQAHSIEVCLPLISQIVQALAYLHSNHIYHFDIKPKNVLVALPQHWEDMRSAHVKLIDFGLAAMHHANRLVGTPSYMAPEMTQRDSPDHRADLYSLGVLLYYSLSGINPFRGENREQTFKRHQSFLPPPPSEYHPVIPQFLDRIIMRLLAKKREDRYYSAAHVLGELLEHLPSDVDRSSVHPSPVQPWEVRFVGRDSLLQDATQCVEAALHGHADRAPLICITGGVGSGKTRLLQEIKYKAQLLGFSTHSFNRLDITSRMNWLAAIDAARDQPHEPMAFFLDDITTLGAEPATLDIIQGMRELLHRVRQALHLSTPAQAIRTLIVVSAPNHSDSLDRLMRSLRIPATVPLSLPLENFTRDELSAYLHELLGRDQTATMLDTVYAQTQGNPMHTAQAMAQRNDTATLASLHAVPRPPSEAEILQVLAVWGAATTYDRISAIVGSHADRTLLQTLVDQGALHYDPIHAEYRFRNRSVQQQQYDQVPPAQRAAWHDHMAELLAKANDTALAQYFHHRLQGQRPESTPCALWELLQAQLAAGDHRNAVVSWQALINETSFLPHTGCWMDAHMQCAMAHCRSHQFQAAMRIYQQLRAALEDHPTEQCRLMVVLEGFGRAALAQHLMHEAETAFSEALAIANEYSIEPADELRLENWLATVSLERGDLDHAIHTFEYTAQAAQHIAAEDRRQLTNNALGMAYLRAQRLEEASATFTQDVHAMEDAPSPLPLLRARFGLAKLDQLQGHPDTALTEYTTLLDTALSMQDAEWLIRIYCEMGVCHSAQHRLAEAMQCFQAADQHAQRVGDPWLSVDTAIAIGNIHRRKDEIQEAEGRFRRALAQLETVTADVSTEGRRFCTVHYQLGSIYLRANDLPRAEFHLGKAKAFATQSMVNHDQLYRIALAIAELLHRRGDHRRYRETLVEAKQLLAANTPDHVPEMSGLFTIEDS